MKIIIENFHKLCQTYCDVNLYLIVFVGEITELSPNCDKLLIQEPKTSLVSLLGLDWTNQLKIKNRYSNSRCVKNSQDEFTADVNNNFTKVGKIHFCG